MSEQATTSEQEPQSPFRPDEIRQFDADDAEAGQAIGKMLSLFFLYTVLAMATSAFLTYIWITSASVN